MDVVAERYIVSLEDNPSPGQLRGVGNRLDPESILFAPETVNGLTWGYTIVDETAKPAIFMDGEWRDFVPEGVWLQMVEAWGKLIETIKDNPEKYSHYLQYPEISTKVNVS